MKSLLIKALTVAALLTISVVSICTTKDALASQSTARSCIGWARFAFDTAVERDKAAKETGQQFVDGAPWLQAYKDRASAWSGHLDELVRNGQAPIIQDEADERHAAGLVIELFTKPDITPAEAFEATRDDCLSYVHATNPADPGQSAAPSKEPGGAAPPEADHDVPTPTLPKVEHRRPGEMTT